MSKPIQIYVDADACPVKNEVYRVAERHGLKVFVVSNSFINVPRDPMIERVVVGQGMDEADNWIAERAVPTTFGKVSFDYKLRRFLGAHHPARGLRRRQERRHAVPCVALVRHGARRDRPYRHHRRSRPRPRPHGTSVAP